ncbi:MAG: TonB-dependent receptor, partial [Steroidobacteraceae bacterium]
INGYGTEMSGNSLPALMGAQVSTEPYETFSNMPPDNNRLHNTTTALKLNWDLPSLRVQSLSAYLDQRHDIGIDFDMSTLTFAHFRALEDSHAFTQEIQLTGQRAGRVDWLLGAFYMQSSEDFAPLSVTTTVPVLGEVTQLIQGDVHTHSYAAFGEATVALTPSFSLTGGLRYSNEEKQLSDFAAGLQGLPPMSLPKRDKEWDDVNYRLVAKYVQGSSTFYAKTETGFKSGAFNNSNPTNPGPIDPEQITAYEVGIKTALPNYPVRLNAAAFYNDYRDLQIQVVDQAAGGVTLLVQAPKAETYGVDLSAEVKPGEHWNISAGVNWLQAEYRKFLANGILVPNPAGGFMATSNIDLADNDLARSPELTANLTVSFDYPVAAGAIFGATNYYRSSRLYFDPANSYSQDAFGVLNAQIGYRSEARWWVSAWSKNLTDETYLSTVIPGQLGGFGIYAAPRTYGLSVGYSFGQ